MIKYHLVSLEVNQRHRSAQLVPIFNRFHPECQYAVNNKTPSEFPAIDYNWKKCPTSKTRFWQSINLTTTTNTTTGCSEQATKIQCSPVFFQDTLCPLVALQIKTKSSFIPNLFSAPVIPGCHSQSM